MGTIALTWSQIQSLTPTQKAKAWGIVRELERREREERIRYFKPTEPPYNDQKAFLFSKAKERWAFGGNRSGKTEVGVADSLLFATGAHPIRSEHRKPPVFIRYIGTSWEDGIKRVIHKKFKQMTIRKHLKGGSWATAYSEKSRTLTFKNGSIMSFMTSEQDVNKHGGDDVDAVYIDEHLPLKYYNENLMRLIDRNGYMVGTMTPELGVTWEADHVKYPPEGVLVEHWFFHTEKNPHISKEGVAMVVASIKDPLLRKAKLYGEFVPLTGMVYPMYKPNLLMIQDFDIPYHWGRTCIIDPHLRKFTAIVWMAWSPDGDCVVYRTKKVKLVVEQLAQFLRAQSAGERIDLWIGDEAMGGEGKNIFGEPSVLAGLQSCGIPVMPTNQSSDKSFKMGVEKVRSYLTPDAVSGKPKLRIFESLNTPPEYIDGKLTGSIFWEFSKYRFRAELKLDEETFREKVATVDDDYMDDLRYGLVAGSIDQDSGVREPPKEVDSFTGW